MKAPAMYVPSGKASPAEQLAAVKEYAVWNYERNGWDIVVETMSDSELQELIFGAKTRWGAIDKVANYVKPIAAHRAEVQSTAF